MTIDLCSDLSHLSPNLSRSAKGEPFGNCQDTDYSTKESLAVHKSSQHNRVILGSNMDNLGRTRNSSVVCDAVEAIRTNITPVGLRLLVSEPKIHTSPTVGTGGLPIIMELNL